MNLVCASSVSFAREAFESLGNLVLVPENEISSQSLVDADVLITRSKTRLTPELLKNSRVQVVGTCTAGVDHVDLDGLRASGITCLSAPGCNANAVSEYIVASLLEAHKKTGFRFENSTLGIVGHGNVGRQVEKKAKTLGMRVLLNDPPLAERTESKQYCSLETVLAESDVLTLHVPLIENGPYPTRNLIGKKELNSLRPGAILLNACRGEVTVNEALLESRRSGQLSFLGLDVWNPEPDLPLPLLKVADLGTAHIAGHSVEGKVNGTLQIRNALCEHFGIKEAWDPGPLLPPPSFSELPYPHTLDFEKILIELISSCYRIDYDDALLRVGIDNMNLNFINLRRSYRDRREWAATRITNCPPDQVTPFLTLGFKI